MPKKIVWSPLSQTDFEKVLDYLHESWNEQVALNFLADIEKILTQISKQPKQFPLVNKKMKVRKCVVSRHNSIFYREKRECLELIRIFDTRQTPSKLKFQQKE
jgi:plasmid stabilization system protein ParE